MATSWKLAVSVQHGQVGKTCNWNPVKIGVGQPLAELGWFDQCSWLLLSSVGLWQICNVATLPGDSFAWQQVGNLQCQCSMGRLASSKCWICLPVQCWSMVRLAGAADFQHLAVARSAFFKTCSWIFVQIQLGREWPDLFCLKTQLECCNLVR